MNKKPYAVLFKIITIIESLSFKKENLSSKLHNLKLKKLVAEFRKFKEFQGYKLSFVDILLVAFMWNSFVSHRRRKNESINILKFL